MTNFFCYLRGAVGDPCLLDQHKEAIDNLLKGLYTQKNIEKLKGHDVYSLRLGDAERLLFTTLNRPENSYLLILEYLPSHDYHKSRFLRSKILQRYRDTYVQSETLPQPELTFQQINSESFADKIKTINVSSTSTVSKVVDYYQDNFIVYNDSQNQAFFLTPPAVVSGVAGSGKTCLAVSLITSYLLNHRDGDESPLRILYTSPSLELVRQTQSQWNNLPSSLDQQHRVSFLTDKELVSGLTDKPLVSEGFFDSWYQKYSTLIRLRNKTQQLSLPVFDKDITYQEFRICSGFNEETYLKLGRRQSLIQLDDRQHMYAMYQEYQKHLHQHGIDPQFFRLEQERLYNFIIVDEAQDFSHLALKNLCQLTENTQIIFCMDSHQRLYDRLSVRPYLMNLLAIGDERHINLDITYRCPLKIVAAANAVIRFKHRLIGGIADKNEVTAIEAIVAEKELGSMYVLDEQQLLSCGDWLTSKKGTDFVVVTREEHRLKARELFHTELVLTPEEIKGLEYPYVVAYYLNEKNMFQSAKKRLEELGDSKQPTHQAKTGKSEDQFGPPLNRIYTTYTRAQHMLVICEEETNYNQEFLNSLKSIADVGLPNSVVGKTTIDDWHQEVIKQIEINNVKLAQHLFLAKNLGDISAFRELV